MRELTLEESIRIIDDFQKQINALWDLQERFKMRELTLEESIRIIDDLTVQLNELEVENEELKAIVKQLMDLLRPIN